MVKNEVGFGCGVFCLGRAVVYVGSSTGVSIVFQVNFTSHCWVVSKLLISTVTGKLLHCLQVQYEYRSTGMHLGLKPEGGGTSNCSLFCGGLLRNPHIQHSSWFSAGCKAFNLSLGAYRWDAEHTMARTILVPTDTCSEARHLLAACPSLGI